MLNMSVFLDFFLQDCSSCVLSNMFPLFDSHLRPERQLVIDSHQITHLKYYRIISVSTYGFKTILTNDEWTQSIFHLQIATDAAYS